MKVNLESYQAVPGHKLQTLTARMPLVTRLPRAYVGTPLLAIWTVELNFQRLLSCRDEKAERLISLFSAFEWM